MVIFILSCLGSESSDFIFQNRDVFIKQSAQRLLCERWLLSESISVFNSVKLRVGLKLNHVVICGAKIANDIYSEVLENEQFFKCDVLPVRLLWLGIR